MDRKEAQKKATELVSQMTVEEAASQLLYDSPAIPRLNIPSYNWWNEGLHGVARAGIATCFPQAIGMSASFDTELLHRIGYAIALEARAKYNAFSAHGDRTRYKGVTLWAPNINIFRDPRWGRGQETFGEDPVLTSTLACSLIEGMQTRVDGYMMTAACAKHFAAHSGPEALRHGFDAKVSEKDLRETYLPAFHACVTKANVEAVMGAYNRTNGEPCCASDYLMKKVLRDEWHFEGHYVSDCWAVRDFHENHHVTDKPEDSAALALKTGCDLNCGCTYEHVLTAYKNGKLKRSDIMQSAVRIFTARYLLGLFDRSRLDEIPYQVVGCREHLDLAYEAAVKSCVLLKNDGILPLHKEKYHTIAVIGPNADSATALLGNYNGTPARTITLLEGIRSHCDVDGIQLHYSEGCQLYKYPRVGRPHENYRAVEAVIAAENSDLTILCVGLDATLEGEQGDTGNEFASGDRPDLLLPKVQRELIESIIQTGKPFIIVNASGSPMDLSAYENYAGAILQVWYPGGEGGRAVADILFGLSAPGGKLPVTFYHNSNALPDMTDYNMKGRTYRYMTEKPWRPFGYGLTYGKINITDVKLCLPDSSYGKPDSEQSADYKCDKDSDKELSYETICRHGVTFSVFCENTGSRDVSDVLQVYAHINGSVDEIPNSRLVAFQRIELKDQKSGCFRLTIPADAFRVVNQEGQYITDGTGVSLYFGFCSPDLSGEVTDALVLNI